MEFANQGLIGKIIQKLKLLGLTRNQWSSLGILVFLLLVLPAAVALTQVSQETRRRAMERPITSPPTPTPTPTPPLTFSCTLLYQKISQAFGATCGNAKYDPVADLNKDRIVNILDFSLFRTNTNSGSDEVACNNYLSNIINPCLGITPTPTPSLPITPTPTPFPPPITIKPTLMPTPPIGGPTPTPTPPLGVTPTPTPPIVFNRPPKILTTSLPLGFLGRAYAAQVKAIDEDKDLEILDISALPPGLVSGCQVAPDRIAITCQISGTPKQVGSYQVKVFAFDNFGNLTKKILNLTIRPWWPWYRFFPPS